MTDPRILKRLVSKVKETPSGCWEWQAAKSSNGYGTFKFKRKTISAHRMAWILICGPIPAGLWVLHHCDNKSCINPVHLYTGTIRENGRDSAIRGRMPKGENHLLSKLKEQDIPKIRVDPRPHLEIAADYGVKRPVIGKIKLRQLWKHVP